jgi:hypothetical protein
VWMLDDKIGTSRGYSKRARRYRIESVGKNGSEARGR